MANKTYLDYYLDNEYENEKKLKEKKEGKKNAWKFNETHEEVIIEYLSGGLTKEEENIIWKDTIYPSLKVIVSGVMKMKNFHFIPKNLDRELLIEDTLLRLIEKLNRFTPGMIGKSGEPVKVFSYLSTVAKNYLIERYQKAARIIENKADVETSIDLQILSEETLEKISGISSMDEALETRFDFMMKKVIRAMENIVYSHSNLESDFVKVGVVIIYIFKNWNKIDFEKKNDFMKFLILYTGLKQANISTIFKNYKIQLEKQGLKNILIINEGNKKKNKDLEIEYSEPIIEEKVNKKELYNFSSFEDFEITLYNEQREGKTK